MDLWTYGPVRLFQSLLECRAHVRRALDHRHAGRSQGLHLLVGGALPARDDRPGVAHPASGRRRLARDEPDHGLPEMPLDPGRRFLLGAAADLADHDDRARVGVLREQLQHVDERRADERVAADANAGGLAEAKLRQLVNRLVGQRAALRHDAYGSLPTDVPGNDARLALARRDDARAVRPDEARRL